MKLKHFWKSTSDTKSFLEEELAEEQKYFTEQRKEFDKEVNGSDESLENSDNADNSDNSDNTAKPETKKKFTVPKWVIIMGIVETFFCSLLAIVDFSMGLGFFIFFLISDSVLTITFNIHKIWFFVIWEIETIFCILLAIVDFSMGLGFWIFFMVVNLMIIVKSKLPSSSSQFTKNDNIKYAADRNNVKYTVSTSPTNNMNYTDSMNGYQYEQFVANNLKKQGFIKADVTPKSGDFGADIIAVDNNGYRVAIQCKKFSSNKVGISAVQEALGATSYYNCNYGMVITNSTFTAKARQFADKTGVKLIERYYFMNNPQNLNTSVIKREPPKHYVSHSYANQTMKPKKKEENPMFTKKGAWLWLVCAPLAMLISGNYEANQSIKKKKAKKAKKDAEFRNKYPEWWFYSD